MKKFFALFYPEFNDKYSDQPMNAQIAIYESAKKQASGWVLATTIVLGGVFLIFLAAKYLTPEINLGIGMYISPIVVCFLSLMGACIVTYRYKQGYYGTTHDEIRQIFTDDIEDL